MPLGPTGICIPLCCIGGIGKPRASPIIVGAPGPTIGFPIGGRFAICGIGNVDAGSGGSECGGGGVYGESGGGELVFGRVTYQGMASYWRTAEGEVAGYMNSLPKLVCSRTLRTADWNNTTIAKDAGAAIAELKRQGDGDIFVFGSANLAETLMAANLFDEYRIGIVPVVAGAGRRLFSDGRKQQLLKLLEARPLSTGCVIVRYQAESAAS